MCFDINSGASMEEEESAKASWEHIVLKCKKGAGSWDQT